MTFTKITAPKPQTWILLGILIAALALRLSGLFHGLGTHPDERHIVMVTMKLSLDDMNPHFFAYGSFPFYILWAIANALSPISKYLISYDGYFLVGRSICIAFGLLAVFFTYLLSQAIYKRALISIIAASLLALNVLHIQLSRFFTVDIILCTTALIVLWACIKISQSNSYKYIIIAALFTGISLATKISALFLGFPILAALIIRQYRNKVIIDKRLILHTLILGVLSILTAILLEPYAILDFETFWANSQEQTKLARGVLRYPYTIQYVDTTPYLYPLKQMFHYTMGWPVASFVFAGLAYTLVKQFKKPLLEELILLSWILPVFLVTAAFQVKYPRYLLPIYPQLFVLAAMLLGWLCCKKISKEASSISKDEAPMTAPEPSPEAFRPQRQSVITKFLTQMPARNRKVLIPIISVVFLISTLVAFSVGRLADNLFLSVFSWGFSLASALMLVFISSKPQDQTPIDFKWQVNELYGFIILIIAAFLLRVVFLSAYPTHLHNDEMTVGLEALRFLSSPRPALFDFGWLDFSNIMSFFHSLSLMVFGESFFALRLNATIGGIVSIIGLFLFLRTAFNTRTAFFGATFLLGLHWHLHFSRTAFYSIYGAALSIWTIYVFYLALSKKHPLFWALCGICAGLCLQANMQAQLILAVIIIYSIVQFLFFAKDKIKLLKALSLMFGFFLLCILPMLPHYLSTPELIFARFAKLYIFSEQANQHLQSVAQVSEAFGLIKYQLQQILSFVLQGSDKSLWYGFQGSFIDIFLLLAFIAGLIYAIVRFKKPAQALLVIWFALITIVLGVLTIDSPFAPRLLGLSFICCALGGRILDKVLELFNKRPQIQISFYLICCLFIALSCSVNLYNYFIEYAAKDPLIRRDQIVRLLAKNPQIKTVLNISAEEENFAHEAYFYIAPGIKGFNYKADNLMQITKDWQKLRRPILLIAPNSARPHINSLLAIRREIGGVLPQHPDYYYFIPYNQAY